MTNVYVVLITQILENDIVIFVILSVHSPNRKDITNIDKIITL